MKLLHKIREIYRRLVLKNIRKNYKRIGLNINNLPDEDVENVIMNFTHRLNNIYKKSQVEYYKIMNDIFKIIDK